MPRFTRYYEPSTWDFRSLAFVKDAAKKEGLYVSNDVSWCKELLRAGSELDQLRAKTASRATTLGNVSIFVIGLFFFMQVLEIAGNFALGLAAMATPLFLAPGIAYVALICRGNFSLHTIISPENTVFRRVIAAVAILSSAIQFIFVVIQITVFCDPTNPLFLASSAYQQLCSNQRVIAISAAVLSAVYLCALVFAAVYDFLVSRAESQYTHRFRESVRDYLHKVTLSAENMKVASRRCEGVLFVLGSIAAEVNAALLEMSNYDSKRYLFFYVPFVDDVVDDIAPRGKTHAVLYDSGALGAELPLTGSGLTDTGRSMAGKRQQISGFRLSSGTVPGTSSLNNTGNYSS